MDNDTYNVFNLIQHIIIPKTDYFVAQRFQILRSFFIILQSILLQMLTSIQFNDKFCFGWTEVRDVVAYCVLTAESDSQLVIPYSWPEFTLGGSGVFAELNGLVFGFGVASFSAWHCAGNYRPHYWIAPAHWTIERTIWRHRKTRSAKQKCTR